jgi:hypothetical protein
MERFVLWSGVREGDEFLVRTAHVPAQTAIRGPDGLCVRVGGEALHGLNVWLFTAHQQLGVQVHSHPTDAYHSETDDAFAMVTQRGGLSLVVPHFGRAGVRSPDVACYRLGALGWYKLREVESDALIRFTA